MPSLEVGRSGYDSYIRNGLMIQLARLKPGEKLEQAHMRNRHMVSSWVLERGQADRVVEKKVRDGKTFYVVNDHLKLRELFGRLLREVQRIKSSGDYEAGKGLVEGYGIEVDPELHGEVLERYGKLGRAPYGGFINPRLIPVEDGDGNVVDVNIEYPEDFTEQMMYYGKELLVPSHLQLKWRKWMPAPRERFAFHTANACGDPLRETPWHGGKGPR